MILHKKQPTQVQLDDLKEKVEILEQLLDYHLFFTGNQVTLADISIGASAPVVKSLFPSLWSDKLDAWLQRTQQVVPALREVNESAAQIN